MLFLAFFVGFTAVAMLALAVMGRASRRLAHAARQDMRAALHAGKRQPTPRDPNGLTIEEADHEDSLEEGSHGE